MKKKLITLILSLVCAATFAFALTACGSDDGEKKTHSQQQWENAFDAAMGQEQDYTFKGGVCLKNEQECSFGGGTYYDGYAENYQIDVKKDAQNASYYYRTEQAADSKWLMKKGEKYYEPYSWEHDNFAVEITDDIYAMQEARLTRELSAVTYVPSVLQQLRTLYNDFKQTDSDADIRYSTGYTLKNVTLTLGEIEVNVARVYVSIYDDTDELHKITLGGIFSTGAYEGALMNAVYMYRDYAGVVDPLYFVVLPEIENKTFSMANYEIDVSHFDSEPEKYDAYQEILNSQFSPNYNGKKVTCNADGTITGDISFGGAAISTYTWTGEKDNITVSNADNPNVSAGEKFTLTGKLETSENGHQLVLHLNVPMGGGDIVPVTFYFSYAS